MKITTELGITDERDNEIGNYVAKNFCRLTTGEIKTISALLKPIPDFAKTTSELIWIAYSFGCQVKDYEQNPLTQMMAKFARELKNIREVTDDNINNA